MGGIGAVFALIPFLSSMSPSEKTKTAAAPVEIDISKIQPGTFKVVAWRGKPVWIVRRTDEMISNIKDNNNILSDPESSKEHQPIYAKNKYRSIKPEYLVLLGICTHLGCSPTYKPDNKSTELGLDWEGGFFCPCHGSKFDLSGRVYKGMPAPHNLEVPPHHYMSDNIIVIGQDGEDV